MIQMIYSTIQLIIAPVVLVTCCSIFLNGLLTRYGAVNDRMRLLARERLEIVMSKMPTTPLTAERMSEINHQLPDLLYRHRLLRDSVFSAYLAVLVFVIDMVVISAAVISGIEWLNVGVLVVFLCGVAILFLSALFALVEIYNSHQSVSYEIRRVLLLERIDGNPL